ncbi:hypothetical protein [Clostridium sp. JS66]|uniref:hypothetical protein n=1 Tax=Clostridium sp. JS66 TaxID=3064705 RepID=UPI00298EC206|nr:hypothetical protein [Clostridium sp. JS66]WPC39312.1 hypothetical protein Q6H37_15455 [Clostridium sp. JS66]
MDWYNYFRSEDLEDDEFYCPYMEFMSRQQQQIGGPPQFGGTPPQMGGGSPSQMGGAPFGPPPNITPSKKNAHAKFMPGTFAVDPGSLRPCRFRYVYIWPRRGRPFWAWLNYVGRRSASGFRWVGHRWVRFGIDLREIETFICF